MAIIPSSVDQLSAAGRLKSGSVVVAILVGVVLGAATPFSVG
jgi:hypothetical protein